MLIQTTYQPFISLFHQTEAVKRHPELAAIRMSHGLFTLLATDLYFSRLRLRPRH
jgi:hypothetical protein